MIATRASTIRRVDVRYYELPTSSPEADGTFSWDKTTLVVVQVSTNALRGIGYTYASASSAKLIEDTLGAQIHGQNALDTPRNWLRMVRSVRNIGRPGIASMAIAAVDMALWDLNAKLLDISILDLLGSSRDGIPAYGSGGFTSYSIDQLQEQLSGWSSQGLHAVKMKVGSSPDQDPDRVKAAREAVGPDTELFVDANGAYTRKQALRLAEMFTQYGVTWLEEPVSSDDLSGLRLIRDRVPIRVAAGEYGYDQYYFKGMLQAGAVDVLQADATRCAGVSGFLAAAKLCDAFSIPLSAHTAPTLHAPLCCSVSAAVNVEYFFDHARIEEAVFEGAIRPSNGILRPDRGKAGFGIEFRENEARKLAA